MGCIQNRACPHVNLLYDGIYCVLWLSIKTDEFNIDSFPKLFHTYFTEIGTVPIGTNATLCRQVLRMLAGRRERNCINTY